MNVVEFRREEPVFSRTHAEMMTKLQLNEQMLSCLDFVIEKASEFEYQESFVEQLRSSRHEMNLKRQQLILDIVANNQ